MTKKTVNIFLSFFLAAYFLLTVPSSLFAANKTSVYMAHIDGIIGVTMEEHVKNVLKTVGNNPDALLVFTLNTPGGLVDSMASIVSDIASAPFPVVAWVAPAGSRSASAGAFIVEAAHIAVMAPETHIGAAHPVSGNGQDITDKEMQRKVLNDLSARMRALAQERSRDEKTAVAMVTSSVSLTAREALNKGIIDFIAIDEQDLLNQLNGRDVLVQGKKRVISLNQSEIIRVEMPLRLRILAFFSRPDIAYLAFIAGVMALILELKTPGGFVLGTTGGILLLIAAYGLRVLPVNFAGIVLLLAGIGVLFADVLVGGMGILAAVGIGTMLLGSLVLFDIPGEVFFHQSMSAAMGVTVVLGVTFIVILRAIYKTFKNRSSMGKEGMVGQIGTVIQLEKNSCMILIRGEYWSAGSITPLQLGDKVRVISVDGLLLNVERQEVEKKEGESL